MCESSKKPDLNDALNEDKPLANVCDSEEDEDEGKWELSKTDYVQEWLHKHCFFDEQTWNAVMKGVEATPEAAQYQCLAKPDPPASNFVLDGAKYTSLQNTCSEKFVLAITRLNNLEKTHEDMLGQLAFPNRMVMQHVTYIIRAFLRRMYFRLQGKSHKEQEMMMRKMHYAMQGIIHRYFKRGLDTLALFEKVQDKEMYGDCMDDSWEDDEEGPSDDESCDEGLAKTESENESDANEEELLQKEDENEKRKRQIRERKMVKKFLSTVVTRHAQDHDGLLSTLEAIYSGKKTLEDALKQDENDNESVAQGQTDGSLTSENGDFKDDAAGMKEDEIDSSDEENEAEEYYIPDNKSHASLEFSDDERIYHHLPDLEDDGDISCCGECDQCILGHYGYCTVKSTVRQRDNNCAMDEEENSASGCENEASELWDEEENSASGCENEASESQDEEENSASGCENEASESQDEEENSASGCENEASELQDEEDGSDSEIECPSDYEGGESSYDEKDEEDECNTEEDSNEENSSGDVSNEKKGMKRKRSPSSEVDSTVVDRLVMEFCDGSDDDEDEKPAWKLSQDVSRNLWMQEMVSDCPKKDKKYSCKFHRGNKALFPQLVRSKYSRQQKKAILAQFKHEDVSRNIRRYVMKTVCRRNFMMCQKLWRRAKGLKRFPGLCMETEDTAAWKSLKQQKNFLNDFMMTEKEALLYGASRKYKVSCEEIFEAKAAMEILRKKRQLTAKIVKFLDQLPIRRLEHLNDHVLTQTQKENGEESQMYSDRTSVLFFLETMARMQGQEQAFPWVDYACRKLQAYVESLVQSIDNEYEFFCNQKVKLARREEMLEKLNSVSEKKKRKYLSAAKIAYERLTQSFLQHKHKYLKRYLPENELNAKFPMCPKDDVGLMHLPRAKRLQLVTSHNKTQLKLRNDYVNMVKEKEQQRNKVMVNMNKFLTQSSAQDIITKVYDIQTQESRHVQSNMVLGGDMIDDLEALPLEYNKSDNKDTETDLNMNDASDEEQDKVPYQEWTEEDLKQEEEEILKEEEMERKAAEMEGKMEPLTVNKIFSDLHVQYFPEGHKILQEKGTVKESYPTSFPFEERPWETPAHHAILDKMVKFLSSIKSRGYRRLNIDFQREIRRLWHDKPKGFVKIIRCYENLRKTYIKKQRKTWGKTVKRIMKVNKSNKDGARNNIDKKFKGTSECNGAEDITNETQDTQMNETDAELCKKRKLEDDEDILEQPDKKLYKVDEEKV